MPLASSYSAVSLYNVNKSINSFFQMQKFLSGFVEVWAC